MIFGSSMGSWRWFENCQRSRASIGCPGRSTSGAEAAWPLIEVLDLSEAEGAAWRKIAEIRRDCSKKGIEW